MTRTDRLKIEALLRARVPLTEIARIVHKSLATIYREMKKGEYLHLNTDYTTEIRYSADKAQEYAESNFSAMGAPLKIGSDHKFAAYVEKKILKEHYSPAAVLGEIMNDKNLSFKTSICVRTLYNYIDKGVFLNLTNKDLLRKGKKKKKHRKVRAKRPPVGESIENRPKEIETREAFGHWEMDTVIGKRGGNKRVFLVFTERKTREEKIILLPDKSTASVVKALDRLERRLGKLFPNIFKTITVDNGSEFDDCAGIERSCLSNGQRTKVYYCHPYTSCERGSNENQNGMIRRFYPKGTSFAKVTQRDINRMCNWINSYPRGILGFRSSSHIYAEEMAQITDEKNP